MVKCVFCSQTYPAGTIVCYTCNEYKGIEEIETTGPISLDQALANVMTLMEEARRYHLDNPSDDCDCDNCNTEEIN